MLKLRAVLLALLVISQLLSVYCQSKSDVECLSKPSGIHVSLSTMKNRTGSWITKIAVEREGGRDLVNTTTTADLWSLDVDSNTLTCDGAGSKLRVTLTITAPLRPDYELFPGVGIYKFHTDVTTWPLARQICADEDAHLIIINSEKESDVTRTLFSRHPKIPGATHVNFAWVGAERKDHEYWTIFGDSLNSTGFMRWGPGQPNKGFEDCLLVERGQGALFDIICEWKVAFICEIEL